MSRSRVAGSASTASKTALAMAKTPGSPEETTATRAPLPRQVEGVAGAVELHPVVAGVPGLPGEFGDPRDIGMIAHEVGRLGERGLRLGRDHAVAAGAEPDDPHPAGHGRRPCPWTRTMEK